jgi:hypothetical protein
LSLRACRTRPMLHQWSIGRNSAVEAEARDDLRWWWLLWLIVLYVVRVCASVVSWQRNKNSGRGG